MAAVRPPSVPGNRRHRPSRANHSTPIGSGNPPAVEDEPDLDAVGRSLAALTGEDDIDWGPMWDATREVVLPLLDNDSPASL
jgi:hypothetical protein